MHHKLRYHAHLQSAYFAEVRRQVWKRDKAECRHCGRNLYGKEGHVHHVSYKWLFHELDNLGSLLLLCPECHRRCHPEKTGTMSLADFFEYLSNWNPPV